MGEERSTGDLLRVLDEPAQPLQKLVGVVAALLRSGKVKTPDELFIYEPSGVH
jgi:hypothetical protein